MKTRDLRHDGHTYIVMPHGSNEYPMTQVWDAELCLFELRGQKWSNEQLKDVLDVYKLGRSVGNSEGRIDAQCVVRRALGL